MDEVNNRHKLVAIVKKEVIIDNSNLAAEKAYAGWFSSIASGESLVCRFRGPGTVLIQTRNPNSFASWMRSLIGTN